MNKSKKEQINSFMAYLSSTHDYCAILAYVLVWLDPDLAASELPSANDCCANATYYCFRPDLPLSRNIIAPPPYHATLLLAYPLNFSRNNLSSDPHFGLILYCAR